MDPVVAGLGLDTCWIEGTQSKAIDHFIHLIEGLVGMGIILFLHLQDIIIVIIIIILIGGVHTFPKSSINPIPRHSMER